MCDHKKVVATREQAFDYVKSGEVFHLQLSPGFVVVVQHVFDIDEQKMRTDAGYDPCFRSMSQGVKLLYPVVLEEFSYSFRKWTMEGDAVNSQAAGLISLMRHMDLMKSHYSIELVSDKHELTNCPCGCFPNIAFQTEPLDSPVNKGVKVYKYCVKHTMLSDSSGLPIAMFNQLVFEDILS